MADSANTTPVPEPAPTTRAGWWQYFQTNSDELDRRMRESPPDCDEETYEAEYQRLAQVRSYIFTAPIQSAADAATKLRAALRSLEVGLRTDGSDVAAIAMVAEWLERS